MNLADITPLPEKEKQGVWRPFQGAEFLIASARNDKYIRALRRKFDSLTPSDRKKPAKTDPLLIEAMAEHILLDWRGEVKNGAVDLKPDIENRKLLLGSAVFREWVATEALDVANYIEGGEAEEVETLKSGDTVAP